MCVNMSIDAGQCTLLTECTLSGRLRNMSMVIPATEARNNFFDILNRVLYGNEVIYIAKVGTKAMVRLEKNPSTEEILDSLAGSITDEDAEIMTKAIKKTRSYPKRKVLSFD